MFQASRLCAKSLRPQLGIEIDLLTDDVPRSVHPDVALCLFRIVKEGLRNLKKHSGVAKAQVRLRRVGGKLFVSVSEGVGFDVHDLGSKEGLGIRSMEERAHLLEGQVEIHSKPGEGTRIEACVPLSAEIRTADRITLNRNRYPLHPRAQTHNLRLLVLYFLITFWMGGTKWCDRHHTRGPFKDCFAKRTSRVSPPVWAPVLASERGCRNGHFSDEGVSPTHPYP